MDLEKHTETVLGIYDAVADPSRWTKILNEISKEAGALGCIIFEWHTHGDGRLLKAPLITSSYERATIDDYITEFGAQESKDQDRFERASLERDGIELVNELNIANNEKVYLEQPNVQRMLQLGIRHRFGCLLDKDNTFRHRFAIQRGEKKGPFTGAEIADLEAILPHVAKALDLCGSLSPDRFARKALLSVIEQLNVGVCILDSKGREFLANSEFYRQQEKFRAFAKNKFENDRLYLNRRDGGKQFFRLLEDSLNHGIFGARPRKEAIIVDSHDIEGALCVEVLPLDRLLENGTSPFKGAMLVCRDTSKTVSIDWKLAKAALRLTDAESEVADLVCRGITNSEIAERRGKSIETVNVQVKKVLSKSRTGNRTQLMRLMYNFSIPQELAP